MNLPEGESRSQKVLDMAQEILRTQVDKLSDDNGDVFQDEIVILTMALGMALSMLCHKSYRTPANKMGEQIGKFVSECMVRIAAIDSSKGDKHGRTSAEKSPWAECE